jgi:hypothetical protein
MGRLDAVGVLLQLHGFPPNLFGSVFLTVSEQSIRIDSGPPARFVCHPHLLSANRMSRERRGQTASLCPRLDRLKTPQVCARATARAAKLPSMIW